MCLPFTKCFCFKPYSYKKNCYIYSITKVESPWKKCFFFIVVLFCSTMNFVTGYATRLQTRWIAAYGVSVIFSEYQSGRCILFLNTMGHRAVHWFTAMTGTHTKQSDEMMLAVIQDKFWLVEQPVCVVHTSHETADFRWQLSFFVLN